jgi:hypothetical protein
MILLLDIKGSNRIINEGDLHFVLGNEISHNRKERLNLVNKTKYFCFASCQTTIQFLHQWNMVFKYTKEDCPNFKDLSKNNSNDTTIHMLELLAI